MFGRTQKVCFAALEFNGSLKQRLEDAEVGCIFGALSCIVGKGGYACQVGHKVRWQLQRSLVILDEG